MQQVGRTFISHQTHNPFIHQTHSSVAFHNSQPYITAGDFFQGRKITISTGCLQQNCKLISFTSHRLIKSSLSQPSAFCERTISRRVSVSGGLCRSPVINLSRSYLVWLCRSVCSTAGCTHLYNCTDMTHRCSCRSGCMSRTCRIHHDLYTEEESFMTN